MGLLAFEFFPLFKDGGCLNYKSFLIKYIRKVVHMPDRKALSSESLCNFEHTALFHYFVALNINTVSFLDFHYI